MEDELNFEISSIQINFISSKRILEINVKYLGHNYFTDIITFNYSEQINILEGELYISYEEASKNAQKFGVPEKFEYFRLVIHGILHLLGYDDQNKNAKLVMKRLENNLLKKFVNQLNLR
ncbi:MAG: rRNA maturation RNase YbeY [Bacteroidetes bacterium]|nr:rRNA maturation RNase YbeY [Bacteroidota bacterium]